MDRQYQNLKLANISTIIGSLLLIIMAALHGSGTTYVSTLINESNSETFIKEVFPILFAHPSIHLLGLAGLGTLTLFMRHEIRKVMLFLSALIVIDSFLAFYLGAIIPGILLILSAFSFVLSGINNENKK